MYKVYKDGKLKSFTFFFDYEEARQFVRKLLRPFRSTSFTPDGSNPIIEGSGYEIRRV